jgi:hypothetical protein
MSISNEVTSTVSELPIEQCDWQQTKGFNMQALSPGDTTLTHHQIEISCNAGISSQPTGSPFMTQHE